MEVRNHRHLTKEKAKSCPGGHALGSGSDILYEPDGLVEQASTDGAPLIYVAINYRLGCKICTNLSQQ
jgi:carboxylesterase type B